MITFRCTVDDVSQVVDAEDKDEAMLWMLTAQMITEEQAERMDIVIE